MANKVDYFEIGTPDGATAKEFYASLFGWNIGPPSEQEYRMVNGEEGGIWDTSAIGGGRWAIFYVHVDDVAETVKNAQELGATVVLPPTTGGGIEFAHLTDPAGNRFGVWRPIS